MELNLHMAVHMCTLNSTFPRGKERLDEEMMLHGVLYGTQKVLCKESFLDDFIFLSQFCKVGPMAAFISQGNWLSEIVPNSPGVKLEVAKSS